MVVQFTSNDLCCNATCYLLYPKYLYASDYFTALRNVTNLGIQVDKMAPHVSQWHGINLPLIFSIIVIILGIILATKVNWKVLTHRLIKTASITNSIVKLIAYLNIMLVVVFVV